MKVFLAIFTPIAILLSNIYLYFYSEHKIATYKKNPPFMIYDFTKSNRLNPASSIKHLLDGTEDTYWIKEREGEPSKDIELELRLSHYYHQGKFVKKNYKSLHIVHCKGKPIAQGTLEVELFLREAINVDKELRLPEEKVLAKYTISNSDSKEIVIDISKDLILQDSSQYPVNIFIIGTKLKHKPDKLNTKVCLSEIFLGE